MTNSSRLCTHTANIFMLTQKDLILGKQLHCLQKICARYGFVLPPSERASLCSQVLTEERKSNSTGWTKTNPALPHSSFRHSSSLASGSINFTSFYFLLLKLTDINTIHMLSEEDVFYCPTSWFWLLYLTIKFGAVKLPEFLKIVDRHKLVEMLQLGNTFFLSLKTCLVSE